MDLTDPVVPGMADEPAADRRGCGTGMAVLAGLIGFGVLIGAVLGYLVAILTR